MKAIIMAAGMGTRISSATNGKPKSLLPNLGGESMIHRSVRMMLDLKIKPVVCLGYKADMIRQNLDGLSVTYYENPFFAVTNNLASLWFSLSELDGEDNILLLSADLYYPKIFLENAIANSSKLRMFVDSSRTTDGDFYLCVNKEGYVEQYGPKLPFGLRHYEYMGFSIIQKEEVLAFAKFVDELVKKGWYKMYFEEALFNFSKKTNQPISLFDVAGFFWREFDFYSDYEIILDYERKNNGTSRKVSSIFPSDAS